MTWRILQILHGPLRGSFHPQLVLGTQPRQHIGQLALLLPRLQNWRQGNQDPFRGPLVRSWAVVQPLSPLHQGLNPCGVRRCGASWCLCLQPPRRSTAGWVSPQLRSAASPLALALQPYANARPCLFDGDRPQRCNPISIRRHAIDCFLEQGSILSGSNDTALTNRGDGLLPGYLYWAAILPVSTSTTLNWLAAGQTGLGHPRHPRRGDVALLQSVRHLVADGDTLANLASREQETVSAQRLFNPQLARYLASAPLPEGVLIQLPAIGVAGPDPNWLKPDPRGPAAGAADRAGRAC